MWIPPVFSLLVAASSPGEIDLLERHKAGLLLLGAAGTHDAALQAAAAQALEIHTDLELEALAALGVDPAGLIACEPAVRIQCWVSKLPPGLRTLLVFALSPGQGAGPLTVSAMLIDLEAASALLPSGRTADQARLEEIENRLFRLVARSHPTIVAPASGRDLASQVTEVIVGFQSALEPMGRWHPNGSLVVLSDQSEAEIQIDGATVGFTRPGRTVIRGVSTGSHLVTVGDEPHERSLIFVRLGAEAELRDLGPKGPGSWLRTGMIYSGAVIAASGIALLIGSAVAGGDDLRFACLSRSAEASCDDFTFRSVSFNSGSAPSVDRESVDSGGLLLVPLGGALVTLGLGIAIGGVLSDPGEDPWITLLIGLGTGAAMYGAGAWLGR